MVSGAAAQCFHVAIVQLGASRQSTDRIALRESPPTC